MDIIFKPIIPRILNGEKVKCYSCGKGTMLPNARDCKKATGCICDYCGEVFAFTKRIDLET